MEPLISVISTVYNTENYLKQMINSVLCQSYKNFEFIIVNDGSPDNSRRIIEKYKKLDNRIFFIDNEKNLGLNTSRFVGIEKSNGKYLFFLDSDDWIPKNALKNLVNKAEMTNSDITYGSYNRCIDKYGIIKKKYNNNFFVPYSIDYDIVKPQLFEDFYISYFGVNKLSVTMWGKLFLKDKIIEAKLKPTKMTMGEDLFFNLHLHPFLSKVSFVEEVVYNYRWGGMTNTFNPTFLEDIKKQFYIKLDSIKKYNYKKAEVYINYELANCFYSHFLNQLLLENISYIELITNIKKEVEDEIYKHLENVKSGKSNLIFNKQSEVIANEIYKTYKSTVYKYKLKKMIANLFS